MGATSLHVDRVSRVHPAPGEDTCSRKPRRRAASPAHPSLRGGGGTSRRAAHRNARPQRRGSATRLAAAEWRERSRGSAWHGHDRYGSPARRGSRPCRRRCASHPPSLRIPSRCGEKALRRVWRASGRSGAAPATSMPAASTRGMAAGAAQPLGGLSVDNAALAVLWFLASGRSSFSGHDPHVPPQPGPPHGHP